jgi:hypothetical protein
MAVAVCIPWIEGAEATLLRNPQRASGSADGHHGA